MPNRPHPIARAGAALTACLFLPHLAAAHHPGGPGNTGNAGPINTVSATTLARGSGIVGIVFDYMSLEALSDDTLAAAALAAHEAGEDHAHVHSLDSISSPSLNLAYGITDDLMVAVRLPHVKRRGIREGHVHHHEGEDGEDHEEAPEAEVHDRGDSSGIGDLSILAQWRFLNRRETGTEAAILLGLKAPTGKTSAHDRSGERFDAEFQPGSGSWDPMFGLAFTQHFGRISFDASALYTLVTEGTQATDLGDRLHYGIAFSYRVTGPSGSEPMYHGAKSHDHEAHDHTSHRHEASGAPALDLVIELNGEWHDKQEALGERDDNSGGHVLYVSPGLRLSQDKWSAFASIGIPIVNDMNGIQSEPDWRLVTGVSIGF